MSKVSPTIAAANRDIIRKFGRSLEPAKRNERHQQGTRQVTAIVAGALIVDHEPIEVLASHHEHGNAQVAFMWEDCGYKAFQQLGLPGYASGDYQSFAWEGSTLIIKGRRPDGRDYSIAIDLE